MTKTIDLKHPEFADERFGLYGDGSPVRLLPGIELLAHPAAVEALREDRVTRSGRSGVPVDCACGAHNAGWVLPGATGPVCDGCVSNAREALASVDRRSPPPPPHPGRVNLRDPRLYDPDQPLRNPTGFDLLKKPATVVALRSGGETPFVFGGNGGPFAPDGPLQCGYCLTRDATWQLPDASPVCDECVAGAKRLLARVDGTGDDDEAA